ncbi:MAG: hypothetical protein VCE43_17660 [Myxococcota bacterium]
MKRKRSRSRAVVAWLGVSVLSLLAGCWLSARMDGPWGMIPGGPFVSSGPDLSCGNLSSIDSADLREVEVEIRPRRPRTITTWNVAVDGSVFLPADFLTPFKRWPHQVLADPRIRVRVGGRIYACQAVPVTEPERIAVLRRTIAAKYAIEPDSWASRAQVWWFELQPVEEPGSSASRNPQQQIP